AALRDDAVGVGAGAAAEEHLLHVAEPAQLAVDEVLALAAAVDAAADLDFFARYAEEAPAVVEGHGDLGHAEAAARRRAVENDVGHLAAAEALGALLAEDPADGVHDIGLSRSVGADNGGQAVGEVELRSLGEALEAGQFQALEHGPSPRRGAGSPPRTAARGLARGA